MRRILAGLAGAALLGAACTGAPAGPTSPARSLDVLPDVAGDRLLVLTDDGTILTIAPDGGDPVVLRRPGPIDVEASQPVWAPDGSAVSWVELSTGGPPATSVLVTSPPERSARTEVRVDAAMFFLQWDPTSSRVAFLGSFQGAIGAGWAEPHADGGPVAQVIGRGQPFYVSWAPDGDRLLVHVGAETLGRLDLDGELVELDERPGLFHAPVWLADGRLVFVTGGSGRQALVVRDGTRTEVLHRFRGAMEFVVSPDAERIAFRVDTGEGFGPVSVLRIDAGRPEVIADVGAMAFEWSPDGRRLLILGQQRTPEGVTNRWFVWDGRTARPVSVPFLPSPRYARDYLPFFGQYAQTMTLWSPDGRAFAFPALIGDRAGVWVQDLDAEEPAFVLEDGSIVAWSPGVE
jgi:hypothetical protein